MGLNKNTFYPTLSFASQDKDEKITVEIVDGPNMTLIELSPAQVTQLMYQIYKESLLRE